MNAATQLQTDYLIVGAGAVGMAFADVLIQETDANIIIVDKHHKPGGHWNEAYSFVTLHQPSAFYGVSSYELSNGKIDQLGLNQGLHELASGAEVLAYFDQVMKRQFLPSGRVQYFPMHEYLHDNPEDIRIRSLISGEEKRIQINRKIVDATFYQTSVPATHTPNFDIADDIEFIALNGLPNLSSDKEEYVVIGGGKTGVDACLWLLENDADPDKITWIMPRDGWWINRKNTQPSKEFLNNILSSQLTQMSAIAESSTIDEMFDALEQGGVLLRLDTDVKPKMFHGATVSEAEVVELRRIKNVVRQGRVQALSRGKINFETTSLSSKDNAIYIDCSARAVPVSDYFPMFQGNTITPQPVRSYQPVFSAAFVAHIEATYQDEALKNELCSLVPLPNHDTDWLVGMAAQMHNQYRWSQEPGLRQWLADNRLDGFTALLTPSDATTAEQYKYFAALKETTPKAASNLPKLLSQIEQ